ncbi:conserved hypothetical protein [Neospora caninum Liverpool]|uniref:ATG C terminal domain-containing protein n=1 Tax=Neospora caninum (strain Liverpool) TaxID=572307 RepID=F0VEQ3_NEOCL|nr:conserved hypothetical protein [Neospora caninum Liverpool]CBZ52197.1 conserved hypothetical protein [Neospora caninum Liverpool]|eukprot:XP_003882229.1 conserved hypothetical protein [Neospora caninum Liverpool]
MRLREPKVEQDTATPEAPPASLPTPTSSRPPLSLPSRILVFFSSFIKEALVSSLRRIVVGPFLKDLDEHQLHVALGKREVSVSHVQVQTAAANQLLLQTGIPVQLREVYIEQIQWLVPWRLRLKGVHVAIERKGRKRERDCEENDVVRGWVLRFHVELIRVCEVDQEGSTVSVQIDGLSASLLSDAASLFSRRSRADDRQVSHRRAGSAPHRKDTTERSWRRYFRGHSSHPKEKREAAEHDEERQRCNGAALGDKKVTGASPKQGVSSLLESRSWDLSNEKPLDENRSSFYLVHRKWLDAPGDLLFVTKPPIPGRTPTRSASSSQDVKGSPTSLVSNYSLASEKAATHVCASDLHASPPPGASRQKTGSDFPRQANPLLEHFCPKPCAPIGGTAPRSASIGATFSDDPELSRSRWNRASGLVGASPEASDRLGAVCGVNVLTGTETRARGRPRVAVAGGFTEPCVRGAGLHRAGTDIDFAFRGHEVLRPREISLEAVCAEREDRGRIAGEADSKGVARFDASGVVGEKEDRNAPTSSDGEEDDDAVQEPSPYSICGVLQMRPSKRLHSPLVGISPVFSPFAATSPGQSRRASVSCASLATPVCACVAKALVSTSPSHSAFDGTQTGGSIALSPGAVPCGSPSPYTPALSAFSVPLAPPSHVPPGPADLPTQFLPSYGGEEVPVAPLAPARGAPSSPPSAHDQHPAVVAAVAAALDASHSSFVGEGGTRGRESLGEDAHFLRASGVSQSPFGARLSGSGVGRSPSAAEAAMQAAAVAGLEFAVRLRFPLFFTCVSMHQVHQLAQVLDRLSSLFQPSSAAFDPPESRSGLAAGEPSSPPSCTCAEKLPEMRRPLFPPGSEEEDERQKRQTTGEQADAGGADDDAPFEKVEPLETALNPRTSTEEKGVCGIARISRTGEEREEQGGPCGGRQALGEERRYGAGKDQGEDAPADVGAEASKDRKRIERAYEDERGPRGTVPGDDDPSQRAAPEQDAARTTEKSGGNSDAQRNAFHPTGRHATGVETERSDEGERVEARGAEDAAEGAAPAQTGGGRGGDHQESGTEGRANGGDRQSRSASLSPPSASLSPPSASLSPPSASLSPPSADPVEQGPEASPLGLEAGGEKHTSVWRRLVSYISSAARRGGRERAGDPSEGCEGSFGARTGTGGHKFRAGWRQKERHIAREGEQGALVSLLEGECRGREGDRAQAASVAPTHAFPPFSGSFGGEEVFASASAGTDIYGDDFVWSDALRFPQRRSLAAPSTFAHPRVFSSGDGDTSDAFAPSARSPPLGDGQDAWLPCRSQREPLSAARNGDPGDAGPRSSARETNQETGRARGEWRDTLDEDASPAVRSGATRPSGDGATASSHRQEEAGRGEACQGNPKKQGDARGGVSTVSSRDTPDTTAPPLPYAWVIHVEILQVYANLVLSQDFRASLLIRERKRLPESLGQLRSASGMGAVEDGRGSLPLFSFSSATESAHPTLRGVSNILSSLRGNRSSALSAGAANTEGGSKKTPLSPETCAGLSPAEWRDRLVDGCRPAWLSGCTLGAARKSPRCFSATASPACSLFRTVTRTTLGDGKKAKGAVQLLIPFPRASFVSFIASDFACTFVSSLPTCLVDAAAVAASAVVSEGGQHASSFSPPLCSSASAFPPWRPARRLPHGFPARPLHPPGSRQLPSSSSSFPSPAVPGGGVSRRRPPARNSFPGECGDSERALWVDRSAEPQGVRSVWPHPPSQRGTDEEWELSCDGRGTRGAAGNLPAVRETNRSFATSDLDHEAVNSASPGFRGSSGNHRVAAHAPTASGPYTTGWSNRTSSAACGRQGGPRSGFPLASSPFLASGSPAATGWHALVSTGQWAVEMHLLRHNWKTGLSPMGDEGISRGDSVEKCFRDDREPVRRKRMHAKRARKPRIASQEAMHRVTGSIAPASCEGRGDTREGRLCETEVGGRRTLDKRGREGQGLNENDDTRKATGASRSTAGASVEDTRGGRGRRGGAGEKGNDESTREAKDQARDTRWSLRATVAGKENANTSTNSVREETGERVEEESQQPAGPPTADAPAWESPRALQREDSEKQCEATEIKREGDGDASDSRDASKRPTADPEGDKRDDREQTADQHETATPHTSSSSSASSLSSSASSASCLSSCSSVTDPVAASGKTAEKRGRGGRRSRCRAAETRTRAQLAAEQAQETAGTVFLRGVGDVMPAGSKSEEEGKREEARESQRASVVPEDGSRQSGVSSSPCCSSAAAGQGSSVASSAQGSRGVAADLDRVIQSEKQPDAGAPLLNDGLDATEFRDCIEVEDGTERERTLLGLSACLRRSENNREGKSEDANGSRSPLGSAGGERERISRRGSALKSDSVGNGVNRRQLLLSQSHALRGDLRLPSLQNADEADGEGLFHISAGSDEGSPRGEDEADKTGQSAFGEESDGCASSVFASAAEADEGEEEERPPVGRVNLGGAARNAERSAAIENRERASRSRGQGVPFGDAWPASDDETDESVFDVLLLFFAAPVCARPPSELPSALSPFVASAGDGMHLTSRSVFHPFHPSSLPHSDSGSSSQSHAGSPSLWGASSPDSGTPAPFRPPFVTASSRIAGESQAGEERTHRMESELRVGVGEAECLECHCLRDSAHPRASAGKNRGEERGRTRAHPGAFGNSGSWPRPRAPLGQETRPNAVPPSADTSGASPFPFFALPAPRLPLVSCTSASSRTALPPTLTLLPLPVPSSQDSAFWATHALPPCDGGASGTCCYGVSPAASAFAAHAQGTRGSGGPTLQGGREEARVPSTRPSTPFAGSPPGRLGHPQGGRARDLLRPYPEDEDSQALVPYPSAPVMHVNIKLQATVGHLSLRVVTEILEFDVGSESPDLKPGPFPRPAAPETPAAPPVETCPAPASASKAERDRSHLPSPVLLWDVVALRIRVAPEFFALMRRRAARPFAPSSLSWPSQTTSGSDRSPCPCSGTETLGAAPARNEASSSTCSASPQRSVAPLGSCAPRSRASFASQASASESVLLDIHHLGRLYFLYPERTETLYSKPRLERAAGNTGCTPRSGSPQASSRSSSLELGQFAWRTQLLLSTCASSSASLSGSAFSMKVPWSSVSTGLARCEGQAFRRPPVSRRRSEALRSGQPPNSDPGVEVADRIFPAPPPLHATHVSAFPGRSAGRERERRRAVASLSEIPDDAARRGDSACGVRDSDSKAARDEASLRFSVDPLLWGPPSRLVLRLSQRAVLKREASNERQGPGRRSAACAAPPGAGNGASSTCAFGASEGGQTEERARGEGEREREGAKPMHAEGMHAEEEALSEIAASWSQSRVSGFWPADVRCDLLSERNLDGDNRHIPLPPVPPPPLPPPPHRLHSLSACPCCSSPRRLPRVERADVCGTPRRSSSRETEEGEKMDITSRWPDKRSRHTPQASLGLPVPCNTLATQASSARSSRASPYASSSAHPLSSSKPCFSCCHLPRGVLPRADASAREQACLPASLSSEGSGASLEDPWRGLLSPNRKREDRAKRERGERSAAAGCDSRSMRTAFAAQSLSWLDRNSLRTDKKVNAKKLRFPRGHRAADEWAVLSCDRLSSYSLFRQAPPKPAFSAGVPSSVAPAWAGASSSVQRDTQLFSPFFSRHGESQPESASTEGQEQPPGDRETWRDDEAIHEEELILTRQQGDDTLAARLNSKGPPSGTPRAASEGTAFPPSFSHARRRSSDRQAPRGTACFEGDLVEEETVEVGVFLPLLHAPLEVSSLLLLRRSFGLVDQFQAWRRATRGRHTSSRRNFYTDGDRRGHEGTEARAESRESRSEEGRREGGANGRFAGFEELRPRSRGGWREGAAGDSGDWGPKPSRKESKVERAEDARGDTRACAPFVRAADDVSGRRCSCERGPNRGASVSCDACVRPPPSRSSSCLLTWSAPGREPRKVLMNRFHLFVDAAVIECGINSSSSRMLMQHGSLGLSPAWGWPSVRSAAGSPSSRSFRQAPAWDRGQPRGVETSRETKAANDEETVETAETKSLQDDRAWETRLLESFSGTLHAARDRGDAGTPCFVPFLRLELGRLQVNLGLGKSAAPGDGRRPRLTGSGGERMTGNRSAKSQALKDAIRRFLLFLPSPSETVVSQSSASLRPQLPPGLMHVDAAVGSVALFGKGGVPFLYTWRAALYRAAASGSSTALAFQQRSSSLASAPSGHCGAHRGEAGHEPRQREGEKSAKAEEAKNAETEDKVESAEDYFVVYDRDQKESVPPEKSTFLTPIQKSVASLAAATRQSLLPSTREEEAPSTKSHLCPSSVSSLPLFAACGEERCSRAGGGGDAETKALREKATGWEDARGDEGTPCWDASAKRAPFVAAMAPCSSLAFSVQAEFCRERHIPHSLQPRPIEAREGPEREEADGPERGEESAEARAGRKAFGWRGGQGELGRMSASSEKQERTTFSFSPSDSSLRVRLRVSSRVPTTTVVTLRETDIALGWLVAVADARALDTVNFLLGSALLLSTIRSSQEGRALSPVETCRLPATVSGPDSPFASLGCKSERRRKPSREGASSSRRLSGDDRRAPLDAPERESSECGATGTAAESGLASRAAGQEKWIETSLLLPGGSAKEDAHMAADIKTDAGAFSPFSSSPVAFRWSPPHKPRATQVSVHLTRSLLVLPRPLGWAAFWRTQQGHARPLSALLARETACELPLSAERERRPQAARPSGASATPFHLRAQPWQSPRDESEEEREEADLPSGLAWLAVLEVDGVSATLLSQHARASLSRRDYEGTQEENEGGVGGRGRRRRRSEVADSRQRGEGDGGRVLRGRADQGKPLSFELSRETKALVSCASLLPGSSFETRASPGCLSSAATPFSAHALSLLGWRVQEAKLHIINEASQTALESAASPRSASSMCHSHQRQNEVMKLLSSIPSPSSLLPPRLFSPSRSRLSSRGSLPNGIEESEESEESEERGRGRGASHRRLSGSACTSASPAHASRFLPLHPALRHCRAEEERQLSLSLDRQDAGVFQTRSPLVVRASEVASILPACGLVCVARLSDVEGSCTSSPLPEETHVELHVNSGEEARETQDRASDETPNGRDRREGETKTVRMLGVYARIGFCRLTLAPDSLRCLLIIPVDLLLLHNAFRHMKEEMHNLMNLLCTLPTQAASLVSTSSASRFSASSLLPSLSSSSSWRSPDSSHWVGESYRVLTALLSQGARASSGFDLSAASYAFPLLLLLLRSRGMLRRENLKAKRISTWLGEDATSGRRQGGTERDESADATRVVESRASWENEGANERDGDWPSSLGYAIHARRTNDGDRKDAISDAIPRIPASCPLSAPSGALASRSGLASSAPGLETRKRFESEEAGIGLPCVEDFWARRIPSLSLRGHEGRSFPECGGLLADIQMDAFSAVPAASPSPFILPPSSSLAWPADPTVPQNRFREDSVCDSVSSGAFKARGASSSFDGEMFTADPRPRQTADDFHLVESLPSSSSRLASFSSSSVHVPAYPAAALPAFRLEEKEGEWRDTSSGRETDAGACGQRAALNRNAERGGILEDYIACPTAPSGEEEKPAPETAPGMHGRPGDGKGGARREGARQTSTGLDTKGLSGRAKKEREDRGEALETQRERGKPSFFVSLERTAQRLDEDHLPFPMTAEMRESEEKEEAARDELYATFFGPALADSETPPKALPSSEAPTSPADHPREGMALWRDSRHSQGFTFAPHFALGSSRHSSSPYAVSAGPETSPLLGGSSLSAASSAAAVCGGQPAGTQLHAAEKEDRTLVSLPGSPEAPPARACPSAGLSRFASSLFAAVPDSLACRHPGRPWAALLDGGRDSGPRQQGGRGTPASAGDWRSEQDAAEDGWRCGVHLHLGRMEINVSRGADFAVVSLRGHEGSGHSASSASRTRPETPKARDARTCGEQERVRGRNGRKRRSRSGGDAASKPSGGRSLGDAEPLAGRNRATGEIPFEACADDRGEQPSRPGRWKEEVAEIVLEAADFVFGGRAGNRENTPASRTRREKAQATHGPVTQRQMVQVAPDGEGRDDHAVETGQAKVTPGASSWGMSSFASSASFASSRSPSGVSLPSGLESPPPRGRRGHFTGKGFASSAAGACRRRVALRIHNFAVRDLVRGSLFSHFVRYYDDQKRPRLASVPMLALSIEEYCLSIQPPGATGACLRGDAPRGSERPARERQRASLNEERECGEKSRERERKPLEREKDKEAERRSGDRQPRSSAPVVRQATPRRDGRREMQKWGEDADTRNENAENEHEMCVQQREGLHRLEEALARPLRTREERESTVETPRNSGRGARHDGAGEGTCVIDPGRAALAPTRAQREPELRRSRTCSPLEYTVEIRLLPLSLTIQQESLDAFEDVNRQLRMAGFVECSQPLFSSSEEDGAGSGSDPDEGDSDDDRGHGDGPFLWGKEDGHLTSGGRRGANRSSEEGSSSLSPSSAPAVGSLRRTRRREQDSPVFCDIFGDRGFRRNAPASPCKVAAMVTSAPRLASCRRQENLRHGARFAEKESAPFAVSAHADAPSSRAHMTECTYTESCGFPTPDKNGLSALADGWRFPPVPAFLSSSLDPFQNNADESPFASSLDRSHPSALSFAASPYYPASPSVPAHPYEDLLPSPSAESAGLQHAFTVSLEGKFTEFLSQKTETHGHRAPDRSCVSSSSSAVSAGASPARGRKTSGVAWREEEAPDGNRLAGRRQRERGDRMGGTAEEGRNCFEDEEDFESVSFGESPFFIRSFDMPPLLLRIDYVPKRLDPTGVCNGQLNEVVNFLVSFCRVEGMEVTLARKAFRSVTSGEVLLEQLLASWADDFNRALVLKCMRGITPFRHVLRLGRRMKAVAQKLLRLSVHHWRTKDLTSKTFFYANYAQYRQFIRNSLLSAGGQEFPHFSWVALKQAAAIIVAASVEGITWSERVMRSAHCLLQILDRRCTPGLCPAYPSSTLRFAPRREDTDTEDDGLASRVLAFPETCERGRGRDLHQRDLQESGRRVAHRQSDASGSTSIRLTARDPSRATNLDEASGMGSSATGLEGERGNDWAVVRLGADGSYEPHTIVHGLSDGFCCVRRGIVSARHVAERLWSPPSSVLSSLAHGGLQDPERRREEQREGRGLVPAVVVGTECIQVLARLLPIFILRPMLGFTEGVTRTLQGTRNQLVPRLREERVAKLREPSYRVQRFTEDEEEGPTPL